MTGRERFLAFAGFEAVDRIPKYADFVDSLRQRLASDLGEDPRRHFEMDTGWAVPGLRPPPGYVVPDYSCYHGDMAGHAGFSIDWNGCGHLNHGYYHFTEYISPLRNAGQFEELEAYPFFDNEGWDDGDMRNAVEAAHAAGQFAKVFIGHMYENAWQVRGYEPFLMDMLVQRDWAEYILEKYCVNNERAARAVAGAGCDCLAIGDDVANQNAMMFQPDMWRAIMKPRWARVIAAARSIKPDIHVWYHSDGNISDILDDLVEIGITILNPVQPECVDPVAIRRRFGSRLAFDGCIGTQTTFPFGTPQDVKDTVEYYVRELDGLNGGLMLSPTHVLEPEVTTLNVQAFFDACNQAVRI